MKAYTNLEQSKKLAEILPIESADMRYSPLGNNIHPWVWPDTFIEKGAIPCWSLAALLNAVPQIKIRGSKKIGYIVYYNKNITLNRSFDIIDACYEMIIKLNEQKLL